MAEQPRSFLLSFSSVRRVVDREVNRRIVPTVRSAHEARDTHRRALTARDELIARLREENDQLGRRLAELEAGNRDLRAALAERQAAERERRERAAQERRRRERNAVIRERESNIRSDLFRCLQCSSLSLLTAWPDRIRTVCQPVGPGCPDCTGRPLRGLPDVKADLATLTEAVARPSTEPPGPFDESLVAGLLTDDPDAGTIARAAGGVTLTRYHRIDPADRCAGLDAIATGVDRTPTAVRDGIAWCATEIPGVPEFPATVLSQLATRAAQEPLSRPAIAREIRLVGAALCAGNGRLGSCPCAGHLGVGVP